MKQLLTIILLAESCTSTKQVPNYRITSEGLETWRYTKPGEVRKDILSTGDTLATTSDTLYIIHKQ